MIATTDYVVKIGDTISIISRDVLGDMERWPEIAAINNIENPNLILPGQVLKLPITDSKKENQLPVLAVLSLVIAGGFYWLVSTRNKKQKTSNKTKQKVSPKVTYKNNQRLRFGP